RTAFHEYFGGVAEARTRSSSEMDDDPRRAGEIPGGRCSTIHRQRCTTAAGAPPEEGGRRACAAPRRQCRRQATGGGAMTAAIYDPSHIKRGRATKAEVEQRREALLAIIDAGRPMTVRQVFYQATVHGLVEKAESGYDLTVMRRAGDLPYDWLA